MSQNTYFYSSILGRISYDALQSAGSFLIKAFELQQTIDQSTRDYKIFFRWLYVAIIRLMEENVPEDIATVTQQEINYLADFLNNFDGGVSDDNTISKKRFNLERVGQYLEDRNLLITSTDDLSQHWEGLVHENACLAECPFVYSHKKELSLVQQHKMLKNSIIEIFQKPEEIIGNDFKLNQVINCLKIERSKVNESRPKVITFMNNAEENTILYAILESESTIMFIDVQSDSTIKSLKIQFHKKPYFESKFTSFGDLSFRHIQLYNETTLSIILDSSSNGKRSSCFVQFPLTNIRELFVEMSGIENIDISKMSRTINMYDVLDASSIKILDGVDWHEVAVSGNRKVASLLSDSRRRIRFYEMEVEEEDDELDTSSHNNSLDISKDSNAQE